MVLRTGRAHAVGIVTYVNDLITFSLYFFGCPATGTDAGPLAFQLIPRAFAGRSFTTADVAALSAAWRTWSASTTFSASTCP